MQSDAIGETLLERAARLVFSRRVFLALGALAVVFCGFAAVDATKVRPNDGTVWVLGRPTVQVLEVVPRGPGIPPTPLRKGDVITGIANHVVTTPQEAADVLGAQRPGATVPYLVERKDKALLLDVPLSGFRVADRSYAVNVILAAVYLVIGTLVYLKSGNDRPARLFFLLCLAFAIYFMTNLERSSYFWGDIITRNGGAFARFMLPALFLQFFLVFPGKKQALARHPYLSPLLYLLPLMFYLRFTLDQFFGDRAAHINTVTWIILGLYYVAGLAALVHSYLSYRDPLLRERVRILTWGTLVGVLPFLVFKIGLEEITARTDLAQLGVIPLVAIPMSFGYCVARYQVLQIEFLVKRSLLFSILTGLLVLGWAIVVFWAGSQLVTLIGSANPLIAVGVTLAVAGVLWPVRNRLQRSLEARLYRSRANLAVLLEQFSREIPGLIQQQALLDRIGRGLQEALELPRLWVYLPDAGGDAATWTRAWPQAPAGVPPALPRQIELGATLKTITQRLEPFWIDLEDALPEAQHLAISREQVELAARRREQRQLASAGVNLLVPLAASGRVIGLIALPAKPGEEAYQLHEIQLLTIVAGQTATQLENARLYEEEVAKQKLEEEMRLAREIQSRLMPAALPTFAGIQFDAVNLSSKTVSGDYYDVIPRVDGQVAMVIADVCGKGMPASLLASNLQASLRAQCDICDSPGDILLRVNRQLHAATDSRHFATVFLAFFDPRTRRLRYSSAGHDAPVVIDADNRISRLAEGGLPLGAFDFGDYDEGAVELRDGDLLLLYTDGLTETKSPDGEDEYGTARLDHFLREHRHLDVGALLPRIDQELQLFRGRRDAEDDITLLALKIAPPSRSAAGSARAAGSVFATNITPEEAS
ncbi:MAG TPA: SpoIIE family protein phosphatase [Candidatus Krumholzibacteria bacterium]|nr:SpoIIE family protein phosphatase [Candidatus Krumholzibacteria bacterium]HPD71007.1 SpoIIE family protein phosphatase [Candidatus Krumholzibacteria bacterium]HRY39293.1 SpoIIE family protein phosphatase [Candidatus Krumholzibacteria bacterium]